MHWFDVFQHCQAVVTLVVPFHCQYKVENYSVVVYGRVVVYVVVKPGLSCTIFYLDTLNCCKVGDQREDATLGDRYVIEKR